jgi:hypothetical protein
MKGELAVFGCRSRPKNNTHRLNNRPQQDLFYLISIFLFTLLARPQKVQAKLFTGGRK